MDQRVPATPLLLPTGVREMIGMLRSGAKYCWPGAECPLQGAVFQVISVIKDALLPDSPAAVGRCLALPVIATAYCEIARRQAAWSQV